MSVEVEGLDDASSTYLFVPEDAEKTAQFIDFHDRKTGEKLPFPMSGKVIVTEKIAQDLDLEIGDLITFKLENSESVSAEIGVITENYVYNYIFISSEDYTHLLGSAPLNSITFLEK
jgi:putative ABC transport system permease protein